MNKILKTLAKIKINSKLPILHTVKITDKQLSVSDLDLTVSAQLQHNIPAGCYSTTQLMLGDYSNPTDLDDYPDAPPIGDLMESIIIDTITLRNLTQIVKHTTYIDNLGPIYLNSIYLDHNNFVAANGHTMAVLRHDHNIKISVIVPSRLISTLADIDIRSNWTLDLHQTGCIAKNAIYSIQTRYIDTQYPDYKLVVDSASQCRTCTIDNSTTNQLIKLLTTIKSAAKLKSNDDHNRIDITIDNTGTKIVSYIIDSPPSYQLPFQSDTPISISLNLQYLLKTLQKNQSYEVYYTNPLNVLIFRSDNLTQYIMPMRPPKTVAPAPDTTTTPPKKQITLKQQILRRAIEALENGEDTTGFCLECGEPTDGVEPDAERYECEDCGAYAVMGAEQIVLMYA